MRGKEEKIRLMQFQGTIFFILDELTFEETIFVLINWSFLEDEEEEKKKWIWPPASGHLFLWYCQSEINLDFLSIIFTSLLFREF